jgi:hypothetical protein
MQTQKSKRFAAWLYACIVSDKFFYGMLTFFVVSSVWIAVSSLYPMAFDEEFHFGLIKLYAQGWSPFSVVQTPQLDVYGSVVTDPSYLYHYLMSFPYRLLHAFIDSQSAIIIILRLMNVAFFGLGIYLFRKVLREIKLSPAITHTVLAIFVLIPVVPLLAGQINYDNLLMPIIATVFLLTIRIRNALKTEHRMPIQNMLWLGLLFLVGSIVKYAFLPIALGVFVYITYLVISTGRKRNMLLTQGLKDMESLSLRMQWLFGLLFVGAILLFSQRYVLNIVNYHNIIPDCDAVVSEERCLAYGPYSRDHGYALTKNNAHVEGPVGYTVRYWSWGMWQRLFFTLAGPTNNYATERPLPIPALTAIVLVVVGALLLVVYGRQILRDYPVFIVFILATVIYVGALWLQEYKSYVDTAQPVAINGRYLLPLLPVLGALFALAYARAFRAIRNANIGAAFVVLVFLLLLQGGGPITYIVRSHPEWFWHDSFVQDANRTLQSALKPVIYENYFLGRE